MQDFKVIIKRSFLCVLINVLLIVCILVIISACSNTITTQPNGTSTQPTDTPTTSATPTTSPTPTTTNITTPTTTNPPGNILTFEDIAINWLYKELDIPTQIRVMTSIDSQLPNVIDYITLESQPELNAVDFSRHLLLFAFMGFQGVTGPTIKVTQIWQIDNTIYVEAFFNQGGPKYQPTHSSPADVVRVSKDNMTQFGEITFILLDQFGEERASAVYNIN